MLTVVLLAIAIAVEVVATALLPRAEGFTNPLWRRRRAAGYGVVDLAAHRDRADDAGLGGVRHLVRRRHGTRGRRRPVFLDEPLGWVKASSLAMIVVGVVGLNLTGAH